LSRERERETERLTLKLTVRTSVSHCVQPSTHVIGLVIPEPIIIIIITRQRRGVATVAALQVVTGKYDETAKNLLHRPILH